MFRDLGVLLAFTDGDVSIPLNAQAGKSGPPMDGKDLHVGDFARGVLPAAAPLAISPATLTGLALGFALKKEPRVAVSFVGEGATSLGAWHEAVNLAAARKLPIVFCVQNNQTALATPVSDQSAARVFGEKAVGYGVPHVTLDGTDPEEIAAAFAWAAERARAGAGPALLELVAMRMCGHAHHDDMLYLGSDPALGFDLPATPEKGYADKELYRAWSAKDPLATYAKKLIGEGVISERDLEEMKRAAAERCAGTFRQIAARPWPDPAGAGSGVTADGPVLAHTAPGAEMREHAKAGGEARVEEAPAFSQNGATYLEAVARGVGDALERDDTFVLGEDVGAPYGNAFLLLKPLLAAHADRILNAPIAEGGILGACAGAALAGLRPIGEMQFNDFVATGFDQLVNNAAKLRYRTGLGVPMVVRMPWGGLRHAGPYHSQDTSPWFARAFGLKIVAPSTPYDARALMRAAVLDDDPVLYYEHIALYRDPTIRQPLGDAPGDVPIGKAAFRRLGKDLSLISYGAYVHRAMACAKTLEAEDGVTCDVLDLRTLAPLDWESVALTVRRTGKVLLVGEDSRTGSILESVGSKIASRLFEFLDAPVRVLGSLDTPVPYAPSLEEAFLVSPELLLGEARALLRY
jgi:2-oxoisovalerate dehydrogenase E1 component